MRAISPILVKVICLGVLAAGASSHQAIAMEGAAQPTAVAPATTASPPLIARRLKRANFERERPSRETRKLADWVVDSGDNQGMPFVLVDKLLAKAFVFYTDGRLRGTAPVLLGLALGDDSVSGIGERSLASIRPEERTTPAGRFVAALDRNLHGTEILWVDYASAISMHPVITSNVGEHRAERLASSTPLDNRISYGCINVPAEFFNRVISPAFKSSNGIVYVLPETRSARTVFASYDVDVLDQPAIHGDFSPVTRAEGPQVTP